VPLWVPGAQSRSTLVVVAADAVAAEADAGSSGADEAAQEATSNPAASVAMDFMSPV